MVHYYDKNQKGPLNLRKIYEVLRGNRLEFYTASGVFSLSKVDNGTKLLANKCLIEDNWKVLDLGCGYGPVGIAIAKAYPSAAVLLADVNKRAVALAKDNIKHNHLKNANAVQSNIFEKINETFDAILLNPPQSAGKELCLEMIEQSKAHLAPEGIFQLVARHNVGGREFEKKMLEMFGNVSELAKKSGYRIYASKN